MKKSVFCILLGIILILMISVAGAEELPADIQDSLQDKVIVASAHWDDTDNETWFVISRTEEKNTLHCFAKENGLWAEAFNTFEAVFQGANRIDLHITEDAWTLPGNESNELEHLEGPFLLMMQYGSDDISVEQMLCFQRSENGIWNLFVLNSYTEQTKLKIHDGEVIYSVPKDKAQMEIVGTIPLCFERDIRLFRLSDVPLTYEQSQSITQ